MARIEHFAIYAADTEALKDFYVDLLGLRVVMEMRGTPPGFFLADDRGTAVEILPRPPATPAISQRWICHFAYWVERDQFDAVLQALEKRGIIFETDTAVNNDDMRTAFFPDPEGNRCQIVWRKRPVTG
jgi:glyoxylase I family protein